MAPAVRLIQWAGGNFSTNPVEPSVYSRIFEAREEILSADDAT